MILLQTVPNNINLKQLRDDVLEVCTKNNIQANIHNLHVWSLTTTQVFGTAHIKLIGKTIEEAQTAFTKVKFETFLELHQTHAAPVDTPSATRTAILIYFFSDSGTYQRSFCKIWYKQFNNSTRIHNIF